MSPLELLERLTAIIPRPRVHLTRYHVGETKPIPVNVRVIAATNRILEEMVKEKTFREDLFFRLNTLRHWPVTKNNYLNFKKIRKI